MRLRELLEEGFEGQVIAYFRYYDRKKENYVSEKKKFESEQSAKDFGSKKGWELYNMEDARP